MSKDNTKATDNGAEVSEDSPKQPAAVPNPFGDLDQVRQILFGAESQQIKEHLNALEKRLNEVVDTLKESVDKRFKVMEASVNKQNEALYNRLDDEQAARAGANSDLVQDIQSVTQALQDNRAQLDEHIAETKNTLITALQEEADKALKDRTDRFDDLSARLEQAVANLNDAKTDRFGLADLLDHLSAGLRNSQ